MFDRPGRSSVVRTGSAFRFRPGARYPPTRHDARGEEPCYGKRSSICRVSLSASTLELQPIAQKHTCASLVQPRLQPASAARIGTGSRPERRTRETRMTVLIRHTGVGMDTATYDRVSPKIIEKLKHTPGFVLHVALPGPDGVVVSELWETKEQHDSWFDENVAPNVP